MNTRSPEIPQATQVEKPKAPFRMDLKPSTIAALLANEYVAVHFESDYQKREASVNMLIASLNDPEISASVELELMQIAMDPNRNSGYRLPANSNIIAEAIRILKDPKTMYMRNSYSEREHHPRIEFAGITPEERALSEQRMLDKRISTGGKLITSYELTPDFEATKSNNGSMDAQDQS